MFISPSVKFIRCGGNNWLQRLVERASLKKQANILAGKCLSNFHCGSKRVIPFQIIRFFSKMKPTTLVQDIEIIDIECVLLCFFSQILSLQNGGFRRAILLVPILRARKFARTRGVKLITFSTTFCKTF